MDSAVEAISVIDHCCKGDMDLLLSQNGESLDVILLCRYLYIYTYT